MSDQNKIFAQVIGAKHIPPQHQEEYAKARIAGILADEIMKQITLKKIDDGHIVFFRATGYWIDKGGE